MAWAGAQHEHVSLEVRRFEGRDRADVRRICCDTADAGAPLEGLLAESNADARHAVYDPSVDESGSRELFADLITAAYTDFFPELAWVACLDGRVVGYLTGCIDEPRLRRVVRFRVLPGALWRAFRRGVLWRRAWMGLALANLDFWRHLDCSHQGALANCSAHLHLNLSVEARGRGAGRELLRNFLDVARARGMRQVTASVREDNARGRSFFEREGFIVLRRRRLFRRPSGRICRGLVHVLSL